MRETIVAALERNAIKFGDRPAVTYPAGSITLTWAELYQKSASLARHLQSQGIQPGDSVALLIPNRPSFAVALFALFQLGARVVPINVRLTPNEINYILQDSDAVALLCDPGLQETGRQAAQGLNLRLLETVDRLEEAAGAGPAARMEHALKAEDTAEILYTSGTTGKPKGVVLSHGAVHAVAAMFAYEMEIRPDSRMLILMPLTHSAPLNLCLLGATYAGAVSVLGDFTPQNLVQLAAQEKTTHFFGAPVAFLLAAQLPNLTGFDLSSMKYWIYGGAPMSREAVLKVRQILPGQLVSVYGLTEAGPNGVALYPHEHEHKAGSIGRYGTVNSVLRVVDDQGRDVAPGEAGEIIIKCASLMDGYYKNPEATAEALKDGWLYTGDVARVDEDGYLWILDRKKDMIISGGVNIYPKEIEDVLTMHPGIADAAVIGVPHPEWGETVKAVLVAKGAPPSPEEVQAFCGQYLAKFKIPKIIEYVEMIPRNASGKILKHILREQARQAAN
ncbi:MAG TPA: long-chain fatty acid--CoA ligase [Clostridia bacterium]|nr:long-chain fatty acid--CoA ligase [Clostridia bacterium]